MAQKLLLLCKPGYNTEMSSGFCKTIKKNSIWGSDPVRHSGDDTEMSTGLGL